MIERKKDRQIDSENERKRERERERERESKIIKKCICVITNREKGQK